MTTNLVKCFHGTSADNLPSILTHGLIADSEEKLWNCSKDAVYCWNPDALIEAGETEADWSEESAFRMAFESAQFALAKSKDCRAVVIEFEVPADELEEDQSCENMTHARCFRGDIPLSAIRKISISNDLSLLRGYFLSFCVNRDFSNISLTDLEARIAKKVSEVIYPEDVDDCVIWERKEF